MIRPSHKLTKFSLFTRSHRVLNELLLEAKKDYMAAEEHSISIYVSDINNSWRHVASRPKRNIVRVGFGTIAIHSLIWLFRRTPLSLIPEFPNYSSMMLGTSWKAKPGMRRAGYRFAEVIYWQVFSFLSFFLLI